MADDNIQSGNIQNCFITGATNGIGKETAIAMAREGMHLFLMVRNATKGEAVKKEITGFCKRVNTAAQ